MNPKSKKTDKVKDKKPKKEKKVDKKEEEKEEKIEENKKEEEKKEEKKPKKKEEKKEEKEEKKEEPEKKSKLKDLLESKDDDKKSKKTKKTKKAKEPKQKKEYSLEFIMQLKEQKIANEELLLSKEVLEHFEKLKKESAQIKKLQSLELEKKKSDVKSKAKKDNSKAEEEFKKTFGEALKDKNIDQKINYYLDNINADNYDFVKKDLLDLIKDSEENQNKFVDLVIKTSIAKSPFIEIYAKLCKSLEKDLSKKGEDKKSTSQFKINLIDKARLLFTSEKFEEDTRDEHKYIKENKFKKNMLGITHFLLELIKAHILTKKVVTNCIQTLFDRYTKNKDNSILKGIYIDSIIIFIEHFEKIIHSKESKITEKEMEEYTKKIDEFIKTLDQIKDEIKEKYLKHKIMRFIEKRKNDYQKNNFEIYLEERIKHIPISYEGDKFCQDIINDRIEKGLDDYINFIEKEGSSDKYAWDDETYLIEKKGQGLDDILEAYFISCGNNFENDAKHIKNYIKELIEYYIGQKKEEEKNNLKNRLIKIFEIVKNDVPMINDVYSHTINMFIENQIMDLIDLELISKSNELTKEELIVLDKILKNLNENSKEKKIKEKIAKLNFVDKNKDKFKWLFE